MIATIGVSACLWFGAACYYYKPIPKYDTETKIKQYIETSFKQAGLDGKKAVKIAYLESGFKVNSKHINSTNSIDRGIFQLNNRWHPEVSDECAYNLQCNVSEAIRIARDSGWQQWSTNRLVDMN